MLLWIYTEWCNVSEDIMHTVFHGVLDNILKEGVYKGVAVWMSTKSALHILES